MSEEEIIARIKNLIDYIEFKPDRKYNTHFAIIAYPEEQWFQAIQGLLKLYNKEKEKNKKYEKYYQCERNLIDKLQRQIKIKNNYFDMIYFVGADYDGYEKAKDLKSVIDDLVDYAIKGKNNDDKSQMYMNGSGKPENILFERIKE